MTRQRSAGDRVNQRVDEHSVSGSGPVAESAPSDRDDVPWRKREAFGGLRYSRWWCAMALKNAAFVSTETDYLGASCRVSS